MRVLDQLAEVPLSAPVALVVRHAERYPVRAAAEFLSAGLTPKGERTAHALGERLTALRPGRSVRLFHSPVPRCTDTARLIAAGVTEAGGRAEVRGVLDALGGPYLRDPVAAVAEFMRRRRAFIRAWFDGEYPDALVVSRKETTRLQLAAILRVWGPSGADPIQVFISHDWNILAIREEILGLRFEEAGWIDPLDGLLLVHEGEHLGVYASDRFERLPL